MLKISSLTYSYDNAAKHPVLDGINLNLQAGKLYAILGNNGCGKSTLLKCIDGMCRCGNSVDVEGVAVDEMSANERARLISYCPQTCHANSLNVYDSVLLGRRPYISFSASATDRAAVDAAINKFSLNDLADKPTNKLSGGEFQRVAIARIFAQDTPIMLLDEPTNNLDVAYQHVLMHNLQDAAAEQGRLVICVLHDINMALTHADELIFMRDGSVIKQCKPADVDTQLFEQVYGVEAEVMEVKGYKAVFI